ncbi:hypothetical protein [Pantoea sp. App145]|uniref:hypothetical protein n=1 Tax=Pantoea sp. App145 TaxID=3071567 RepID=UPI003A7FB545
MTIEQQWRQESHLQGRQEGRQEGRQAGRQEGRQEGIQEAKLQVAQRMLRDNIDVKTIMKFTGLSEGDLQQLNS